MEEQPSSDKGGKVALIIGGTGMAACELLPQLLEQPAEEWSDVILFTSSSVTTATFRTKRPFSVLQGASLEDRQSLIHGLQQINKPVTHVFWFLEANKPPEIPYIISLRALVNAVASVQPILRNIIQLMPKHLTRQLYRMQAYLAGSGSSKRNEIWLENLLSALKELQHPLESFCLGTGGKHYGMHLGPLTFPSYSCPFIEDKTRSPGPLSYFDQERVLETKSKELGFAFSVVRPSFIVGLSPRMNGKRTQSLGLVIAVYATILKAKGLPLYFPGSSATWKSLSQLSTAEDIARISIWASNNQRCRNQAFNVPSTHAFSWNDGTWNSIATFFGMKCEEPPRNSISGFSCHEFVGEDGKLLWDALQHNQLVRQDLLFGNVFNPDFFDKSFSPFWDATFSDLKLRDFGYDLNMKPAGEVFQSYFNLLIQEKIIPDPAELSKFCDRVQEDASMTSENHSCCRHVQLS